MSGPFHAEAYARFKSDPKRQAFQWWIRQVAAERFPRETIPSLSGAAVRPVSVKAAAEMILTYEWLGRMGSPKACYGLFVNDEMIGVTSMGWPTMPASRNLCGEDNAGLTISLERGTCVHYAPKNAASHLISASCRLAAAEHGWRVFFAYADEEAGEIGNVYQACNWLYIGQGAGHGKSRAEWLDEEGVRRSSRTLRHRGWKTADALAAGWTKYMAATKHRYVHFEGDRRERRILEKALRYPTLPYPKRPEPVDFLTPVIH